MVESQATKGSSFDPVQLGNRVRFSAIYRRVSLKELAERAGIPYGTLLTYLSGKHVMPVTALALISNALQVDPGYLLFGKEYLLNERALNGALVLQAHLRRGQVRTIGDEARMLAAAYSFFLDDMIAPKVVPDEEPGVVTFVTEVPREGQ